MNLNISKCLRILGKTSILETKPLHIHGINPKLIYEPSGKAFELPRFCSDEMIMARQMNKTSIRQIKTPIVRQYTKATPEDLKRLTSDKIIDSYSRVEWTNPKDGKIYNILKQGETKDGKILVRILDKDGKFIKEAELTPKTILIPDDYETGTTVFGIPHGTLVSTYARRFNPFAKYSKIQIQRVELEDKKILEKIADHIKREPTDYISCSYGSTVYLNDKVDLPENMRKILSEKFGYDRFVNGKRRVFISANNATIPEEYSDIQKCSNNFLCVNEKVEGVGSLTDKDAKVSNFSMSRNSKLTQHYEMGEFTPTITKEGLNITGCAGTDLPFPTKALEKYAKNPFLGKPVDRVQKILKLINDRIKELEREKLSLFNGKKTIQEMIKEQSKIDEKIHLYMMRKNKLFSYMNELSAIGDKYNIRASKITGTSFSTPVRVAKISLNDMLEGII